MIGEINFHFQVYRATEKQQSCVLCLAGRGGDGGSLARDYRYFGNLHNTMFIGVTPLRLKASQYGGTYTAVEWYAQPYSPEDQTEAVRGLEYARNQIEKIIHKVMEVHEIPRERIALTGFSAGAVMSLYAAMHSTPLAGVAAHAGAILETNNVKKNDTPIFLTHGRNDGCFDWYERYVPAKNALVENKCNAWAFEHNGGHWVTTPEVLAGSKFLAGKLGYNNYDDTDYRRVKKQHGRELILPVRYEEIPPDWTPNSNMRYLFQW